MHLFNLERKFSIIHVFLKNIVIKIPVFFNVDNTIYIYIYICMYVYIYIYIYMCVCVCVCV